MKLNLIKRIAPLILISIFFTACEGGKKTIVHETRVQSDLGGTENTGGGNGVNGKPLESYIEKNLENTSSYRQYVRPLISELEVQYPRLAADFYHITFQRQWYFIPGEIDVISKNIIGTYAKTDQLALQDLNKIWIDSNKYQSMSTRDQATLLIHEIVMGIRLMQFKSRQDHCIAKAALLIFQKQEVTYGDQRKKCRKAFPVIDGTRNEKFKLSSDDYDFIRRLVSLLDTQNPDVEEVKSLIEAHNFRSHND